MILTRHRIQKVNFSLTGCRYEHAFWAMAERGTFQLDYGITLVILKIMKTAISIPDSIFEAADRLARRLGISRSELYAKAVSTYVERHRQEGITAALNKVYGAQSRDSQLDAVIRALQEASVPREQW